MTASTLPAAGFGRGVLGRLAGLVRLAAAVVLALHPFGAVLVLGWLMRLMRDEEALARGRLGGAAVPRRAALPRWLGLRTLWMTLRDGVTALLTLLAGTLPFTALWLLAWWGGWENSFNKGYEQAWVGPVVALAGVGVALPLLARLPMALAHQAAEGRMSAFFARRRVAQLIRAAGWRYVALAAVATLAAMPLFALTALPTFVEGWRPGFADRGPEEIEAFVARYRLAATAYLVLALVALRRWAARLHARAALRLEAGPIGLGAGWLLRTALLWALAFGLVAQVYVGQFANHQWVAWLLPPLQVLPFFPALTPIP